MVRADCNQPTPCPPTRSGGGDSEGHRTSPEETTRTFAERTRHWYVPTTTHATIEEEWTCPTNVPSKP